MTRINTNVSSLTAQKTLAKSNVQMQEALTRLSTGLRINSGKDDPAGLIASEALKSDIATTQQAISNSQRANQMVATADSALGQVSSLLNDIRGLVTQAANKGALSDSQIAANQLQVDSSLEAINRISQTTSFQGRKLLDGSLDFVVGNWTGDSTKVSNLQLTQANLGASEDLSVTIDVSGVADTAQVTSTVNTAGAKADMTVTFNDTKTLVLQAKNTGEDMNGYTVQFVEQNGQGATTPMANLNGHTIKIYVDDTTDTDIDDIKDALDKNADIAALFSTTSGGGIYEAGTDTALTGTSAGGTSDGLQHALVFELSGNNGSQVFNFAAATSGDDIANAINLVSDSTGVAADFNAGTLTLESVGVGSSAFLNIKRITGDQTFSAMHAVGTDLAVKVNGVTAQTDGNNLSVNTPSLAMSATVSTAGTYVFHATSGGALFQIGPQVARGQQARIGIQSVSTGSLGGISGKLYQLGSGQTAALKTDAATAGKIIDEALSQVTSIRGRLGAFQKSTLDTNIATLTDTIENLTAANSAISDADFAQETANLTRAQVLVQSGTSVLSIANKNPENVLALLR